MERLMPCTPLKRFVNQILLITLLLSQAPTASGRAALVAMPSAGADLTVEVSITPALPATNEQVTITVIARNIGNLSTTGDRVMVDLYVDPAQRPPSQSTAGFPIIDVPSLSAGASTQGTRQHTFTANGCDHVIYVWIDRVGALAEANEDNNLVELPVCVGVTCTADSYEVDNRCDSAQWLTENNTQAHSFCTVTQTQDDEDWVKFTAFAGIQYTVATSNQQLHASPRVTIIKNCSGAVESGPTDHSAVWTPGASGVYYAKLLRKEGVTGPLTAYSLTLTSNTGVTDDFEPDNTCATARDITTDGATQTRRFIAPGDEDWVKFAVKAGESFIALGSNTGTGVTPVITLFTACNDLPDDASAVAAATGNATVNAAVNTDTIYYARVRNQNAASFGQNATYDLSVTASACVNDTFEKDDATGQAKDLTLGAPQTNHNFCPSSDADWVKFNVEANKTYVLQTENPGFAADTVLTLFADDGVTQLAENDDYSYVRASRLVWKPSTNGANFARVRHHNLIANGPNTQYDLALREGFCQPDAQEGAFGDNGPGDAVPMPIDGTIKAYTFCADPLNTNLGDQDWLRFNAVAGGNYQVKTLNLGKNADPVLTLYASDGATVLQTADDDGLGQSARLNFTATIPGAYYVQVRQFNTSIVGTLTDYAVQIAANEPPPPPPTPPPTPPPPPTVTPTPTPDPAGVKTLILTNRARVEAIYGQAKANTLMDKLFNLANDVQVVGAVIQVENDASVAAAYDVWTADSTALADQDKANAVVAAVRNHVLAFLATAPQVTNVVIIGDDRIIPFRRVLDRVNPQGPAALFVEPNYANAVGANSTVQAALAANMILTDDYLVDKVPSEWNDPQKNKYELFIADYGLGRLIEEPDEIIAFIDSFLAGEKTITPNKVLITGYDFVQDSAVDIDKLYRNDLITPDRQLVAPTWPGAALRTKYLSANPRFDVYAVHGHSTHVAAGVPDKNDILASELLSATADMRGALIYSLGCHAGLNDPAVLDLPQAYIKRLATYVGNTGFGWGGSGAVYTEAVMVNFTRELLRHTKASVGNALAIGKKNHFAQAQMLGVDAFDAKALMQITLYGLPMVEMTSGGTLTDETPFPSAQGVLTPPAAFGALGAGTVGYQLPNSFAAFGEETNTQGRTFNLDGNTTFSAGEPVQPKYFANVASPAAGPLRGALLLGAVYSDVVAVDPVIALAENEYVMDKAEPPFYAESFYPAVPFAIRADPSIDRAGDTVVMSLGQFRSSVAARGASNNGITRVFSQMALATFFSRSPDVNPAAISFVDGVFNPSDGQGDIKVETTDSSGIHQVVIAFDNGQGKWQSKGLAFDLRAQKWTGTITGTASTVFFVQVVDGAGNVTIDDNKGRYYLLAQPLPLASGNPIQRKLYLPIIRAGKEVQ